MFIVNWCMIEYWIIIEFCVNKVNKILFVLLCLFWFYVNELRLNLI